ncbi:energy transducer TonB [Methylophilus sp. 14]|uniref:energy transducer TonB n=1 Tax=Methylophilus sp. 14 TaxID=2781019 RepID=UPI0018902E33|nr:energy transducer TonB [Methylophilus sp. 14]MBF4988405.1 energy transducer TonB [Methylophilus sp. 14]
MNKLLLGIFFTFVSFASHVYASCGEENGAASVKDRLEYPLESRRLREEGKTILKVLVDKTGHLVEVKVHESSGFSRLDEVAMESVKSFCFIPARKAGEPFAAWILVPITFKLDQ